MTRKAQFSFGFNQLFMLGGFMAENALRFFKRRMAVGQLLLFAQTVVTFGAVFSRPMGIDNLRS